MGNSTSTIPQDRIHPVNTPLEFGRPTKNFSDGLAPLMEQAATAGDGPKFKSTLEKIDECSTSCSSYSKRKLG